MNISGYDGGWVLAGAFAGENLRSINNCTANAEGSGNHLKVERDQSAIGGIAGKNGIGNSNDGYITNCVNYSTIWGSGDAGGIVGENYSGTVSGCTNNGTIMRWHHSYGARSTGGIAGVQKDWGTISNCINYGTIKYTNARTQSESIQPNMGQILGYNQGGNYSNLTCNGTVDKGSLYAYNYGLFGWSYHDQALYVSNGAVGRG